MNSLQKQKKTNKAYYWSLSSSLISRLFSLFDFHFLLLDFILMIILVFFYLFFLPFLLHMDFAVQTTMLHPTHTHTTLECLQNKKTNICLHIQIQNLFAIDLWLSTCSLLLNCIFIGEHHILIVSIFQSMKFLFLRMFSFEWNIFR